MSKWLAVACLIAALPGLVAGQTQYPIFTENFESGLGAWAAKVYIPGDANDDIPLVFDNNGVASNGTPIYGPNTGFPGTRSVGYSSDLDPWDGNSPQWLQRQWPAHLAPGQYQVSLTVDAYIYWEGNTQPPTDSDIFGLANRVYVFTDSLYDDPAVDTNAGSFPAGDGLRKSIWVGYTDDWAHNGVWWRDMNMTGQIDTTTGNVEVRLLMFEKYSQQQTVAWDNVRLVITPVSGGPAVLDYTEDFEDGYADWTYLVWRNQSPPGQSNDTPLTFSPTDPLLFANQGNPGSTSAGYSSNLSNWDGTNGYMQQLFAGAVPGGETYAVTFEYDCYVYRYPYPNNDQFTLFPGPGGTGIYGPNTGYQQGSQSVGVSYDPTAHDNTEYVWIRQLHPAAVPADPDAGTTYDVRLQADVYVYLANGGGEWQSGSRILFLTDDQYNDPNGVDPNGDVSPGFRMDTWNHESAGTWVHIDQTTPVTTRTGNIEVRLVADDKMQVDPGQFTIAWDNVTFTISQPGGGPVVYTIADNFESGYGSWTLGMPHDSDPWGVGNRMYILTDDQYDDPTWNFDGGSMGGGMQMSYWPGDLDWVFDGVWRHVVSEGYISTTTGNIEVRLLHHDKNSGAQAVAWDNLSLTLTRMPPPCGDIRFDRDIDGDVDQADFAILQTCYTGDADPNGRFDSAACKCFDTDNALDVDQLDMTAFEACVSGPGLAADSTCDDSLPPPLP